MTRSNGNSPEAMAGKPNTPAGRGAFGPIGRRSFLAATALAGASVIAAPAWAAPTGSSPELVAGGIAPSGMLPDEVSDWEIADLVSHLDDHRSLGGFIGVQALSASGGGTTTYAGETMYETAVTQAKAAYPHGSKRAIIAGPDAAWIDALSASGLAASVGPILFSEKDEMNSSSMKALKALGVEKVIIVGGKNAVGTGVEKDLKNAKIGVEKRVWGEEYHDTQLAIFNYGLDKGYWNKDLIILATGSGFADALSVSPVAFAKKAPIFVASWDNGLTTAQQDAWRAAAKKGYGKQVAIVGGPNVVSSDARSFASAMREIANGSGKAEWIWGEDQYDTSAAIAEWAVKSQGFTWNNVAFTTGYEPWDALAGSVLQGVDGSVMLLANDPREVTITTAAKYKSQISRVRFFGGRNAMPSDVRTSVTTLLSDRIKSESTGISYSDMLDLEVTASKSTQGYSRSEIDSSMNPANFEYGDAGYYQFAILNEGYSGKVTAKQLNSFIDTHGEDGQLAGRGQDFIDAAKKYKTNEVYLLAHAILESAWGTSQLAMGTEVKGKTYYNFFGIGAYDSDPLGGGASTAGSSGWNTQRNAILGAALWIRNNYHSNIYGQNTLYKMRWNYPQAADEDTVWKQYATSRTWATGIASVMESCFSYCGLNMTSCGLNFMVPDYKLPEQL